MKLIVTGQARHGKDTVCEILAFLGLSFESSSKYVCDSVVYPILKEKYGYVSPQECYSERLYHRQEWFELIKAYNAEDKAKLGKLLFTEYDIYCGLRNDEEFHALQEQNIFDYSIWVNANTRKGMTEGTDSLRISQEDCNYVIYNNGSKQDLILSTLAIYNEILSKTEQ